MNFLKQTLFALLFFTFYSSLAQEWRGTINSDWNNPSNWSSWPLNNQSILIDPVNYTGAAASPVITANSAFTPNQLLVQNGATITTFGNLTVAGRIEIIGAGTSLTINSGTVQTTGSGSQGRIIVGDDAATTVNGGLLKSSQRIISEFGGIITVSSGTLNSVSELALVDGSANQDSKIIVNGGYIHAGSMLEFENENGTHEPAFIMNAGNLLVGSDIFWLGVAPGAGKPKFIMNGGTATVNGNILNDPLSTVNLFFSLSGSAVFNFYGTTIDLPFAGDSLLQNGNALFNINSVLSINNNGTVRSAGGQYNFAGTTSLLGTGTYTLNSLTVQAGKVLSQVTPTLLTIHGDFINHGSFIHNNQTVSLSGVMPQTLGGSSPTPFSTLRVSNSAGISLNTSVTIGDSLNLLNGVIYPNVVNALTIADNAVSSEGSTQSYINGPITKQGDDAFVFPVGKNGKWRRISISAPQNIATAYTAEYITGSFANPNNVTAPLTAASNIEYWMLNKNSTDSAIVNLYWENAAQSGISDCSALSIAQWQNSAWVNLPANANGVCAGNGSGKIGTSGHVTTSGTLTFGFFADVYPQNITLCQGQSLIVGSSSYSISGTYVDLLSNINQQDSIVLSNLTIIQPVTTSQTVSICPGENLTIGASNYSVSGFYSNTLTAASGCDSIVNTTLIVKTPVNKQVTQSGIILSAMNTSASAYQWIDCSSNLAIPGATTSVFTPQQNGLYAVALVENACGDTSACYQVSSVNLDHLESQSFKVYPNPAKDELTITFQEYCESMIRLTDLTGRLIEEKRSGTKEIKLQCGHLNPGVYILELLNDLHVKKVRVVIE